MRGGLGTATRLLAAVSGSLSLVEGLRGALDGIPLIAADSGIGAITLEPLPFREAIEFFNAKGLKISPNSWRDVWAEEYVRNFTVARVTSMDVLEDIRGAVAEAVRNGTTLKDFQATLGKTLERKGWLAPSGEKAEIDLPDGSTRKRLTPWRLETIFRTNLQTAYSVGRYREMLETALDRPYWMYDAVNDARTRLTHAAMDGRIFHYLHPIWRKWYPPNDFNCRCTVIALSERKLSRMGRTAQKEGVNVEPGEGFAYNPGEKYWEPDMSRYAPRPAPAAAPPPKPEIPQKPELKPAPKPGPKPELEPPPAPAVKPAPKFSPEQKGLPGPVEILQKEGIPKPTSMGQVADTLERIRAAYRETGIETAPRIDLIRGTIGDNNGEANYTAGALRLSNAAYDAVARAVKQGRVADRDIDRFRTLTHELGHLLGKPIDLDLYWDSESYRALCQTVNDVWARDNMLAMLRGLHIEFSAEAAEKAIVKGNTGYQLYVERLRIILKEVGLTKLEQKELVARLNLEVDPAEYSTELWKVIQARTGIWKNHDFGDALSELKPFAELVFDIRGAK